MGNFCDLIHGLKPTMMMVTVQVVLAGVNIFYKLAGNNGFSLRVLIAYRFLFAAATVVPLALVLERKNRPKLTWKIAFQAFICALFGGSLAQNMYAESLVLTSATFAAAMSNLIPAVTFVLAIFFRMERLGLNTRAGKAKVAGTVLCIGGAMVLTFYKGCQVNIWSTHFDLLHKYHQPGGHVAASHHRPINNILGPLLALGCCISVSLSLIVQTKMSEIYPCNYSSTALISIMGSFQTVVFALCTERDWSQWKLGWNLRLLTVAYMGIMASGIMWVFTMSCVRMRGPLFVSVFNPLLLVLVALVGSLLLNETLHLGSVLGAVVIIVGLYSVLWGKSKEVKKITRLVPSKSFAEQVENGEATKDGESFKGINHGSNIMAVTPNFLPDSENIEVFDEDEEQDLEANKGDQIKSSM
ncbi:nodulin MtN21 /EamA-like transporter family protein [Striga asiatica]|uniref:WAT1-related protein n=1 Tax=Striga asiatica TaxID=4170 RepID=A0A5A7QPN8_STRAF|nr:nodulin MtN21 /EamA-like transporter family protein [Striga asiatica]